VRQRKIRKRMGCCQYYFCPCLKAQWEKLYPKQQVVKPKGEDEKKKEERKGRIDKKKEDELM